MMKFVEMSKQEINICVWELMNGKEDTDTWECLKRLKKPASFMTSLYKKTCKLNGVDPDVNIIDKFKTHLDGLLQVKKEVMKLEKEEVVVLDGPKRLEVVHEPDSKIIHHDNNNPPRMISRKRKE